MALCVIPCCNANGSPQCAQEEMLVPYSDMVLNSVNTDTLLFVRLGRPSMCKAVVSTQSFLRKRGLVFSFVSLKMISLKMVIVFPRSKAVMGCMFSVYQAFCRCAPGHCHRGSLMLCLIFSLG